jgi:hypothetical protein
MVAVPDGHGIFEKAKTTAWKINFQILWRIIRLEAASAP